MKPDFVIIGGQRSGSTLLMRVLGDHPSVYLPVGETRYFRDPWFQMQTPDVLDADMHTDKPDVRRRGIKCPDLLGEPTTPQRLLDVLGTVDLVATLREPVDRAISAYYWGMQWGWIPLAHPEVGLRCILSGEYASDYPRASEVLEYGLYGRNLMHFYDAFPAEKIFVLVDNDLRTDFDASAAKLLAFLGLDETVPLQDRQAKVNEGVYSMRRLRLLRHRHRYILRTYPGYPGKFLQPAQGIRGKLVNRGISVIDRLVLARVMNNTRPPISAKLRGALYDFFRDDIKALEGILDRDLQVWRDRNEDYIRSAP